MTRREIIVTWVAVIATMLLSAEILWTVSDIWESLDLLTQLTLIFGTFLVVIIFGWRKVPKGF